MVAANLKAETMKLMEKRSAMEAEMNSIIDRLCQRGGPGLSGNLLDSEGFPRADIDIPAIRAERHRLAELKNDHKEITERINENIQVLHLARLAPKISSSNDSVTSVSSHIGAMRDAPTSMDVDMIISIPFAVVDEIADASPAAEDGLQLGDQIVKFGDVECQAGENLLQKLAHESHVNRGLQVPVVVMRQGAPINLTIRPREWQGRGLLGCSFRLP